MPHRVAVNGKTGYVVPYTPAVTGRWVTHTPVYLSARPDAGRCVDPELLAMFTDLSGSTRTNEQFGDDARAARLLEVAEPYEIPVTGPVADGCDAGALVDRGLVRLKGVAPPRRSLSMRWDRDETDAPGPAGSRPSPRRVA